MASQRNPLSVFGFFIPVVLECLIFCHGSVEKLSFRSELAFLNGTFPDDSFNDIATNVDAARIVDCDITANSTQEFSTISKICPVASRTLVAELDVQSNASLEFFVIGLNPFVEFLDSSAGNLYLRQTAYRNSTYNVSIAVTNMCGMYSLVTVLINVKCAIPALTTPEPDLTAPDLHVSAREKSSRPESPVCPPRLISPSDYAFSVACLNSTPSGFYVPPGSIVGQLAFEGSGNFSFVQREQSNFVVDANGTVFVGGYIMQDGYAGILSLNISDLSGSCATSTFVDIEIKINCSQSDILPDSSTEPPYLNGTESWPNLTSAAMPDGFLIGPMERSDPTPPLGSSTVPYSSLGIPPGVVLR